MFRLHRLTFNDNFMSSRRTTKDFCLASRLDVVVYCWYRWRGYMLLTDMAVMVHQKTLGRTQVRTSLCHISLGWQDASEMPNLSSKQTLFWKMPFLRLMLFLLEAGGCPVFDPVKGWVMSVGPLHLRGLASLASLTFSQRCHMRLEKFSMRYKRWVISTDTFAILLNYGFEFLFLRFLSDLAHRQVSIYISGFWEFLPKIGKGKLSGGGGEISIRSNWLSELAVRLFLSHFLLTSRIQPSHTFAVG